MIGTYKANNEPYKVNVPEGVSGAWKIERVTVTPKDEEFERLRAIFSGGRYVHAGTYTRLIRGGETIMSDTPDEVRDMSYAIYQARGEVLVNGLGLGVYLNAIMKKPEVQHVTVIEYSEDVINLVAPHYLSQYPDRLEIIHANAFEYQPPKGKHYNAVWHDIWDSICADNLPEMAKLHRKYGKRCDWQGSWCKGYCQRER